MMTRSAVVLVMMSCKVVVGMIRLLAVLAMAPSPMEGVMIPSMVEAAGDDIIVGNGVDIIRAVSWRCFYRW